LGLSQALSWVADLGFDGMDFFFCPKIVVDTLMVETNTILSFILLFIVVGMFLAILFTIMWLSLAGGKQMRSLMN